MKVAIVIVKLLVLGALFIVSNQNLYLLDSTDRAVFVEDYTTWIQNLVYQSGDVTGYIVKFEWLPKNGYVAPG